MDALLRERLSARFVSRLCHDTVEVWRYTATSDGRGGVTQDWRRIGTHKGRLMAGPGGEGIPGGVIEVVARWRLLLHVSVDIQPRDRVYRPGSTSQYWEVTGSDSGQTELLIQHVDIEERTG